MNTSRAALIEGAKEWLRMITIALVPILYASYNSLSGEVKLNRTIILGALFIATVKAVDKYVHENDNINATGLLPF